MKGNYLSKYTKLAKHCMKGKVSVTLATLVSLLITGQVALGATTSTELNGGSYKVESDENYDNIGFNVESGSNTILFDNSGNYEIYVGNPGEGVESAVGVNITGGNRLTIAEEFSTEGTIYVGASDDATGIEGVTSGNYTLKNSADLNIYSGYGDTQGVDLDNDGESTDLDVENSGDINLYAVGFGEGSQETGRKAVGISTFTNGNEGTSTVENTGDITTAYDNEENRNELEGPEFSVEFNSSTGIESYTMGDDRIDSVINGGNIDVYAYERSVGIETATDGDDNLSKVKNDGYVYARSDQEDSAGMSSIVHGGEDNTLCL